MVYLVPFGKNFHLQVLSAFVACAFAAPTHVNEGVPVGPLTPAFGDAVQTPKGLRSLALEGFSEDRNQDGFVDPIGQAVVPVVQYAAAPVQHAVQYAAAPVHQAVQYASYVPQQVAPAPAVTYAAAPAVTYTHAVPQVYTHAVATAAVPASTELLAKTVVPQVQYVAAPHVQYAAASVQQFVPQVFNHGFLPFGVAPVAAPVAAAAAAPVEEVAAAPAVEAVE